MLILPDFQQSYYPWGNVRLKSCGMNFYAVWKKVRSWYPVLIFYSSVMGRFTGILAPSLDN